MNKATLVIICLLLLLISTAVFADRGGVIFYSGFEKGINADYAAGSPAAKMIGGKPSFVDGKIGKAILSGDTNGYLAYSTDKNVIPERGTIEFWFNPVNWNGNDDKFHVFFETKGASSITIYKYFDISYSSAIFMVSPTPEPKFRPQALGNMTGAKPGEWHHIAVTWTQKEIRIYIDGKASRPENLWTRELVKLGASFAFGDRSWNARSGCETLLDELYIYNRPLTESEVAWAYTHGQNRIPGDDIQAGVANRVWAKVTKLPFKGRIHLDVTTSGCSSFTGKAWIEPSGKTVPADIKMVEPGRGSADILVKDLPAGNYKVKAEAKDASGNLIGTYEESFISPGPAVFIFGYLATLRSPDYLLSVCLGYKTDGPCQDGFVLRHHSGWEA